MRVVIAGLALLVAACGFSPMYAPAGGGTAIGPVQVDEIEGKAGHVLRTELTRILSVENNGSAASHLEITLVEQVTPLGIRRDESSTRAELRLTANYVLTPPTAAADAMRGSVVTSVNYDIPTAAFGEIFFSGLPRRCDLFHACAAFDLFTKLRCSGNHIKWPAVVNIFIRWRLPFEIVRIQIVHRFDQRDARDDRFEGFAVCHVNLHAVAKLGYVFLKGRFEAVRAKSNAGQIVFVQMLGQLV